MMELSQLKLSLTKSFLLHLILFFLLFGLGADLFKGSMKSENTKLTYLKSAVKVDLVAMPELTLKELKSLQASAPKEVAPSEPIDDLPKDMNQSEIEFNKLKDKNSFLKRIRKLSRKSVRVKKKVKTKKKKNQKKLSDPAIQKLILAGNKLSKGSSLIGGGLNQEQSDFSNYGAEVIEQLKPLWRLPSYLMGRGYRCEVRLFISDTGELIRADLSKSSGNNEYDQKALSVLKEASPFPVPDDSIIRRLRRGDMLLAFPFPDS